MKPGELAVVNEQAKTETQDNVKRRLTRDIVYAVARGRLGLAALLCRHLLAMRRDDPDILVWLAVAEAGQGYAEAAAAALDEAALLRGPAAHPWPELQAALRRLDQAPLIEPQLRACVAHNPECPVVAVALAELLHEFGQLDAAAAVLAALLTRVPGDASAHHLMAMVQFDRCDLLAAECHAEQATICAPDLAAAWSNLGMIRKTLGAFRPAMDAHDRAVALAPQAPQIRLNRAIALLRAERLREGWVDYECRLAVGGVASAQARGLHPSRLLPSVSSLASLEGRTVLVTHEEGFGDTLHFLRYGPLLAARGARVLAWVPPELRRLMAGVAGLAGVVDGAGLAPPHDFHCPAFSLPRAFETDLSNIPPAEYLTPDARLVTVWADRLETMAGTDGLRVGLVWAGQARPWVSSFSQLDRRRSLSLADLAPLAGIAGVRFISLQKGPAAAALRQPPAGLMVADAMPAARDFADTAAIIANLDLVVSVDTAVVHLAGSLGKPVLLLDRFDACWRWFAGREDSPWYPRLRIFRQDRMGDWTAPVLRLRDALAAQADAANAVETVIRAA